MEESNAALRTRLSEVEAERDDLQITLDLIWTASRRATKRWQEVHPGNDLVWPDGTDLLVWLMDQRDEAFARANEAARLSAAARDETEGWRKDFETLKEYCGILERDRTERDAWTLNTAARHGLTAGSEDPWGALPGLYLLIGRLLDQQRDRLTAYEQLEAAAPGLRALYAFWHIWENHIATLDPGDELAATGIASLLTIEDCHVLDEAAGAVRTTIDPVLEFLKDMRTLPAEVDQ